MSAVLSWDVDNGDQVSDLAGLTSALVRIQGRADTVIGFPVDAPPPPPDTGARDYVLNIVSNPIAHQAMLGVMKSIEQDVLQGVIIDDDEP
jgi:hypothetical protein